MNDFDKIFWGFIFSAFGIALGWSLNQIGQWFRVRHEDKKNLKVILFNLLETYFVFIRSDLDWLVKEVTEKVHSKIPKEHQNEESKKFLQNIYSDIVTNSLKPDLLKEIESVQVNYQKSINKLSEIDPLIAYYLNGKTNVFEFYEYFQKGLNIILKKIPLEKSEMEKASNEVLNIINPNYYKNTLDDLEGNIRNISCKINPVTWLKSKNAIKRLKANAKDRVSKEIDKIFEKLDE